MRKNGSRLISIKQYRTTDLFFFAVILIVAELISGFAAKHFPAGYFFSFSLMAPIVLLIMMRWGWQGIPYAVAAGLIDCLISSESATAINYLTYIAGNAFIALMLLPLYLIGKQKVRSTWFASTLFAVGGWLCVYLGRSLMWMLGCALFPAEGNVLWGGFVSFAVNDLFSLAMSVVVILTLRRIDGMFEDQVAFLTRLDREKKERMRLDQMGENLGEIDEETFKLLDRNDDLYY